MNTQRKALRLLLNAIKEMWLQRNPEGKDPDDTLLVRGQACLHTGARCRRHGQPGRRAITPEVDTCCLNKQKAAKLRVNLAAGALDLNLEEAQMQVILLPK